MIKFCKTIKNDVGYCHIRVYTNSKKLEVAIFKNNSNISEPIEYFPSLELATNHVNNELGIN